MIEPGTKDDHDLLKQLEQRISGVSSNIPEPKKKNFFSKINPFKK
jgi:hypothetical protein